MTHKVEDTIMMLPVTQRMAAAIMEYAEDQLNQEHEPDVVATYEQDHATAREWFMEFYMMETATVVGENDRVVMYEHPTKGDEAPLMLYHKVSKHFEEDSGFWDADDLDEICAAYDRIENAG